jgi:site-specific recombinase XerD
VKPFHVTRWLDGHPAWNGGRRHAVIALKRVYSWADQQGILSPDPLRTVRAERVKRRTRILTQAELDEILSVIRDRQFREFMQAMLETGCRASEVARVTAAMVNLDIGVWVLSEHKTEKKTQKPRVVYLTPAMVELSRKLMAEYPEGPIFRSPRRKSAITRQGIRRRFRRLRAKLPHLKHFICANLRATFATQALANGVGVAQVAELLGHADTTMVAKHFGMQFQNINNGYQIDIQDLLRHAATGNICRINVHPDSLYLLEPKPGDYPLLPLNGQQFAWGTSGAGSGALAAAIRSDVLGDEAKARRLAPDFKLKVIARLEGDRLALSEEDIRMAALELERQCRPRR